MKELLELNKKFLIKAYLWISGTLTLGFSFYLFFFYSETSAKWIFIVYILTLFVLPLFVIGTWTFDWFRKRKYKNRILNQKPYSQLEQIGFNRKTIKPNHNSLKDYAPFAEINGCQVIFDIDINKSNVAQFQIYGLTNHLSNSDFRQKMKELKSFNIDFNSYGFTKMINTRREKLISIQQLEKALVEFTHIVKRLKYEPIPINLWHKVEAEKKPVGNNV